MKQRELRDDNSESLVVQYKDAAMHHGLATQAGDFETANAQYEIIAAVYRELRSRGSKAQIGLLGLFTDRNPDVRLWASTHALEFAPEQAEPILRDLMRSGGLVGFNAEMTLTEWKDGNLIFP